jgi:hypothetical protein
MVLNKEDVFIFIFSTSVPRRDFKDFLQPYSLLFNFFFFQGLTTFMFEQLENTLINFMALKLIII